MNKSSPETTTNSTVKIVSEVVCEEVIDTESAFIAIENVFAAMASGDAYNFPVIRDEFIVAQDITPIEDVINQAHPGRSSDDEITLFDGTGVGLQDLAVASVALKLAAEKGKVVSISL